MESSFVNFANFLPSNLYALSPESKQSKPKGNEPVVSYHEIVLQYNYGTVEQPKVDKLQKEEPECYSSGGIYSSEKDGRKSYSICAKWSTSKPETKQFMEAHMGMYMGCAQVVNTNKAALKIFSFRLDNPDIMEMGFKNPVSYPKDKLTGQAIPGKDPQMWIKIIPGKSVFTDLQGKTLNWKLLENVDMTFIPVIHFEKLYGNGKTASLQIKLASAVVTSIKPRNAGDLQKGTIQKYVASNPTALSALEEQIAKITLERQALILASEDGKKGAAPAAAAASAAAAKGKDQPSTGGAMVQLKDFVAGAPTASPPSPGPVPALPTGFTNLRLPTTQFS